MLRRFAAAAWLFPEIYATGKIMVKKRKPSQPKESFFESGTTPWTRRWRTSRNCRRDCGKRNAEIAGRGMDGPDPFRRRSWSERLKHRGAIGGGPALPSGGADSRRIAGAFRGEMRMRKSDGREVGQHGPLFKPEKNGQSSLEDQPGFSLLQRSFFGQARCGEYTNRGPETLPPGD